MRILFYLPLARRWMLENVLEPMIDKLASRADVHVMVPAIWIEGRAAAWHRNVTLHPLKMERGDLDALDVTGPPPEIIEAAAAIAPDHCLCRSANASLPGRFPGRVQYIMEASAPPFRLSPHWVSLQPGIFDHGMTPQLPNEQRAALVALITPVWREMEQARPRDPSWRARHDLPTDRRIVALPLEYDHRDNLFAIHRNVRPNAALVSRMAARLPASLFLAATDHPLNILFLDQHDLRETIAANANRAILLPPSAAGGDITSILAQHADGMIVGDSKSFAAAAFHGTPILRTSTFASGSWMRAYTDLDGFAADLAAGRARAADRADAMLWFAHYLSAQAFAPRDAEVSGDEIVERIEGGVRPESWRAMLARVTRLQHDHTGGSPSMGDKAK